MELQLAGAAIDGDPDAKREEGRLVSPLSRPVEEDDARDTALLVQS